MPTRSMTNDGHCFPGLCSFCGKVSVPECSNTAIWARVLLQLVQHVSSRSHSLTRLGCTNLSCFVATSISGVLVTQSCWPFTVLFQFCSTYEQKPSFPKKIQILMSIENTILTVNKADIQTIPLHVHKLAASGLGGEEGVPVDTTRYSLARCYTPYEEGEEGVTPGLKPAFEPMTHWLENQRLDQLSHSGSIHTDCQLSLIATKMDQKKK